MNPVQPLRLYGERRTAVQRWCAEHGLDVRYVVELEDLGSMQVLVTRFLVNPDGSVQRTNDMTYASYGPRTIWELPSGVTPMGAKTELVVVDVCSVPPWLCWD